MKPIVLLTPAIALLQLSAAAKETVQERSWDEAYDMAQSLVANMTINDKVAIVSGVGFGLGQCIGNTRKTSGIFPQLCLQDGPVGVRDAKSTSVFPAGITTAATWDRNLIQTRGADLGYEFRHKGVHVALGPSVDILRAPQAGRNWEGFGEDPYLNGEATGATVRGIQSQGVIATAKHFTGYNQETNRNTYSTEVDDRTLHEVYLWPYARAIEAGLGAVMCSYNNINGTHACQDEHTLNTTLKGEMGFRGWVMSDWFATHSTANGINAGQDMDMPGRSGHFGSSLKRAVKKGKVTPERLTDMVERIVAAYYKLGQEKDYPAVSLDDANVNVQANHKRDIRAIGAAATVLLSNKDNILPIVPGKVKQISVIGEDAGGAVFGPNACILHSCNSGTLAVGGGSGSAAFPYLVTPADAIQERARNASIDVKIATSNIFSAHKAEGADIAFVFVNAFAQESFDRSNLDLDHNGNKLIEDVAKKNNNTVVIIHSGGPVNMPWIENPSIKAVLWAGYPGQESGNSITDVLFGDVNPSGRLPFTIAKHEADYCAKTTSDSTIPYTEKLNVGYRWFEALNIKPLFPFGYGLSYTDFKYSHLEVTSKNKQVQASVQVENTGKVDGAEVIQAYLSFPDAAHEPPKVLRGFEKVAIKAGKSTSVHFKLGKTELSIWDPKSRDWKIVSGRYKLHIGASSADIRLSAEFKL